jgi:large subunit ribosomal protein L21
MAEGGTVELDRVLLIADDDKVTVGKPAIEDAKVLATVQQNGRGKKVIVFKYKPKVRYRRKNGHRQLYTRLAIDKILPTGVEEAKPVKKTTRRKKKEVTEDGT